MQEDINAKSVELHESHLSVRNNEPQCRSECTIVENFDPQPGSGTLGLESTPADKEAPDGPASATPSLDVSTPDKEVPNGCECIIVEKSVTQTYSSTLDLEASNPIDLDKQTSAGPDSVDPKEMQPEIICVDSEPLETDLVVKSEVVTDIDNGVKERTTTKRGHDDEILSLETERKRPKLTHIQIPKINTNGTDALMTTITTANKDLHHLSCDQIHEIQSIVLNNIVQAALNKKTGERGPLFTGTPVHSCKCVRLWCSDVASQIWLEKALENTTLNNGERLLVTNEDVFTRYMGCGIPLPSEWTESIKVLLLLRYQNSWAQVDRWLFRRLETQTKISWFVVSIPEDIIPDIIKRNCRLSFALQSVYIKFIVGRQLVDHLPEVDPQERTCPVTNESEQTTSGAEESDTNDETGKQFVHVTQSDDDWLSIGSGDECIQGLSDMLTENQGTLVGKDGTPTEKKATLVEQEGSLKEKEGS